MKRLAALALMAIVATSLFAQKGPTEVDSDRVPLTKTSGSVLIRNAKVITITKGTLEGTDVLIEKGKITRIGKGISAPSGVPVIDGSGRILMPGIVDTHSHRGLDGTNEGTDSVTPEASVRWAINPTAKNVWLAAASGHTTALLLHGSASAIGGESVVVKYKYNHKVDDMIFPGAPRMVKFALGENVTRKSSTSSTRYPQSRLGVETVYRRAFTEAREYKKRRDRGEKMPRDIRLEYLADILDQKIWVNCHSYRADEMLMMVRLSQEFGFKLGTLQHALEAYKIAPELQKAGIGVGMFADHWAYKMEAYDAIPFNASVCTIAGVNVSINSDGTGGYTSLNIDAGKTMRWGGMSEQQALQMLTINGARQLGIDKKVGSIEVGKDGDVVLWDGHPLSTYSKPMMTIIDGEVIFERRDKHGVDKLSTTKNSLDAFKFEPAPAVPKASRVYAITGATLHTMAGAPYEGTIVVRDGKIDAIGARVQIPSGAVIVDARGKRIYPGMFDAGNSIGISEIPGISVMTDMTEMGQNQPDINARTALWPESVYYGTSRFSGITHSLSRPMGGRISGQAVVVQHAGYTTEELGIAPKAALVINFPTVISYRDLDTDMFCCGSDSWTDLGRSWLEGRVPPPNKIHTGEGHDHDHEHAELPAFLEVTQDQLPAQIQSLQEYFDKAREYADKHDRIDLRMEAMVPYVKGEKPVLFRVRNAASIRAAVDFGKRNKLKVILSGADEAWLEADMLAREKVPVIIGAAGESTLGAVGTTRAYDPYDTAFVAPGILARAGVLFAFQTEDGALAMDLPMQVGTSCAFGLKPDDALKALTINAAKILGVDDRLGSLEVGKSADFFVCNGDPLDMTCNLQYLFIGGKPVPLVSKHTELRDKYMARLK